MPSLAAALVKRGFADEEFRKILGENAVRAFDAVRKNRGWKLSAGGCMISPRAVSIFDLAGWDFPFIIGTVFLPGLVYQICLVYQNCLVCQI